MYKLNYTFVTVSVKFVVLTCRITNVMFLQ